MEVGLLPLQIVMIQQKITHCIGKVPRPRVDGHPGGLVHHHDVSILVQDVQGPGGGDHPAAPLGVGQPHGEHLPRLGDIPGVHPDPVGQDAVGQPLDPPHYRPRQAQVALQQGVHPDPRRLRRDGKFQTAAHSFLDQRYMWNI